MTRHWYASFSFGMSEYLSSSAALISEPFPTLRASQYILLRFAITRPSCCLNSIPPSILALHIHRLGHTLHNIPLVCRRTLRFNISIKMYY